VDEAHTTMSEGQARGRVPWGRVALVWLPVLVWPALIFALSSIPSLGTGLGGWDVVLRKLAHITEYAVLAFLLRRALSAPWAFAAAVLYAISDELHQTFVRGREGRPRDVLVDVIGIVLGLLAARRRA
jgi:VanZ family protein